MSYRTLTGPMLVSTLFVCVFLPGTGQAQVGIGVGVGVGPRVGWAGPGYYPYSNWNYPYLPGGPFLYPGYGYPYFGWPNYRGAHGSFWSNGLSLYGPPVPVYGPIPGVLGNSDLTRQWRASPTLGGGFGIYGWAGPYSAWPRNRPGSVNVYSPDDPRPTVKHGRNVGGITIESIHGPSPATVAQPGGCLVLSVKVAQPAAEVFVDGVKTTQTGTDRLFESPPLEAGKSYEYEVTARWIQGGATVERKKVVSGKPGEVVRVDLSAP